jgi:hypothetical protein
VLKKQAAGGNGRAHIESQGIDVRRGFLIHNGDSGPVRAGAAVRLANSGGSQVDVNVFSNEGGRRRWGILATAGIYSAYNNVFYQNNDGILADTGHPTIVAKNNIWYGSSGQTRYDLNIQAGTYRVATVVASL